jgi:hypothetical protein
LISNQLHAIETRLQTLQKSHSPNLFIINNLQQDKKEENDLDFNLSKFFSIFQNASLLVLLFFSLLDREHSDLVYGVD